MQVQIWNSFSCNNSGDYYLVARFADAKKAAKMSTEISSFFYHHAEQADAHDEILDEATPAAIAFGKKYGVKWTDALRWGDDVLSGDTPSVEVADGTLVIYHEYCGGFGDELPAILKKAGAKVSSDSGAPRLACRFTLPSGKAGEGLAAELAEFLEQRTKFEFVSDFEDEAPWGGAKLPNEMAKNVVWGSDGKTFAFTLPFGISGLDDLKSYLKGKKVKDASITLCDDAAVKAIEKLAKQAKPKPKPKPAATTTPAFNPAGKKFLFTGKLATMSRHDAKRRIAELGGVAAGSVSKDLDYLVVGDEGSPLYGAGAKGDKLLAAETLIAGGAKLKIISENAFLSIPSGGKAKAKPKK